MAVRVAQNGRQGLERGPTLGYWPFQATLLNNVFDLSTPSMRKGDEGEKNREDKKTGKKERK